MFQDISIEKLNELRGKNEITVIDVRSPSEYAESTIPGSINIPFFTDEERAEIGTLYKQVSIHTAKERGLEIMSAKLPAFVKKFAEIQGNKAVFCWRGGMRSRTTATVLSLMGIHVYPTSTAVTGLIADGWSKRWGPWNFRRKFTCCTDIPEQAKRRF